MRAKRAFYLRLFCHRYLQFLSARSNKKKIVMPQYKLTYFGIRGRAEATRMIFRAVG